MNERVENWKLVGTNIRRARILQGCTQGELALRAGVTPSTVFNAERGRPLIRRSLERICQGLDCSVEHILSRERTHLTPDVDLLVHRSEKAVWTTLSDHRPKVPEDDHARIQNPQERARLGRLRLVPGFVCAATFIMPDGPGPIMLEIYGRFEGSLNPTIYRDCILMCAGGEARVAIADRSVVLGAGDVVGYRSADLQWIEALGDDLPARLTWVGAVRLGKLPTDFGPGVRVRGRREE